MVCFGSANYNDDFSNNRLSMLLLLPYCYQCCYCYRTVVIVTLKLTCGSVLFDSSLIQVLYIPILERADASALESQTGFDLE